MAVSERVVAAPRQAVFRALTDAQRYPQWLGGARHVEVHDPRWPLPDSSFDHEVGVGPVHVQDSTSVEDVEPGRTLRLLVRARPFLVADVTFELHGHPAGTLLRMTEVPRAPFSLLSPVIAPLVRIRNDLSLRRFAAMVEGASDRRSPGDR